MPRGIGERLAAHLALVAAGLGEADRFQAEDREDAGHDIEDEAAKQRAAEREQEAVTPTSPVSLRCLARR